MVALIVEDSDDNARLIQIGIKDLVNEIHKVKTIADAKEFLSQNRPDIIILDILLEDGLGYCIIDFAHEIFEVCPPIIILSAYYHAARDLSYKDYTAFLMKPFQMQTLRNLVIKTSFVNFNS